MAIPCTNNNHFNGMRRAYYANLISNFLRREEHSILGELTANSDFPVETTQRDAWIEEIRILKTALLEHGERGGLYFEYSIPRLGSRIDVVLIIDHVVFALEFKVGEHAFQSHAIDQVWDYALDLTNFHEECHGRPVAPILIATGATEFSQSIEITDHNDKLLKPICTGAGDLQTIINRVIDFLPGDTIDPGKWVQGRYRPTPTIIEAATALYNGHSVEDISRSDAGATNLTITSEVLSGIIRDAKAESKKCICFVTGVPGAGKTLVGLNIATKHFDRENELYSVFLSGNGPLVEILREALARDKVARGRQRGEKTKKGEALSEVKMFIQNVHHFRDDCLIDLAQPPIEHVALFDEAQRAWDREQTSYFMRRKKHVSGFDQSEPEFLISCLNRHDQWAVIVCLVGGGQEINTGEAGITEWIDALLRSYPDWHIYISSRLSDSEYDAGRALERLSTRRNVVYKPELHLGVSLRSFRAEDVSLLVKQILDLELAGARETLGRIRDRYPIVITRDLPKAKDWLRRKARGSERFGIVASSQAVRLKPHAIDVRSPMDPVNWLLNDKTDVRSSYYLEDVATEFHIQGLELDWVCVAWNGDFRHSSSGWDHWSFVGQRWNRIRKTDRKTYLKNAYKVLLTRARQGMVIFVPEGESIDPTRDSSYYDPTYEYLKGIGFSTI